MENKEKIAVLLKVAGISPAHLGWGYLTEAIMMVLENHNSINLLTKSIYPSLAKKFDATDKAIERSIRHSVEGAFAIMPEDVKFKIFGNTINWNGKVTNGEFIATIAELITTEPNNPIWEWVK